MNSKQTGRVRKNRVGVAYARFLKTACLFFLFAVIGVLILVRSKNEGFPWQRQEILITAHRGASHDAPENTKASIALAISQIFFHSSAFLQPTR